MREPKSFGGQLPEGAAPRIVIVCDDARRLAMGSVPGQAVLEEKGEAQRCSFGQLRDPAEADRARQWAVSAHLILFALSSPGDLPDDVKAWIESWVHRRNAREGTLVGLVMDRPGLRASPSLAELYLRHTARRAGMDYLSRLPQTFRWSIPDSLDSYGRRAETVTSVLNKILDTRQSPAPPR
jgi:hypothetical protein